METSDSEKVLEKTIFGDGREEMVMRFLVLVIWWRRMKTEGCIYSWKKGKRDVENRDVVSWNGNLKMSEEWEKWWKVTIILLNNLLGQILIFGNTISVPFSLLKYQFCPLTDICGFPFNYLTNFKDIVMLSFALH